MGRNSGRRPCAGRRQPEFSRNEYRPDGGIRTNRQILEGRRRTQDRSDVRAHSGTRRYKARAADVGAGEGAPGGAVTSFEYLRPESLDELLSLLRAHGSHARLLAGGTDLLVRLKKGPAFGYGLGEGS